jgi:type I restriction enzyme, S subunit
MTMGQVMAEFYDGPHATPPPASDGPTYLGIKNLTEDGHLDFSDIRHISENDFPTWTRRVEPRPGDLVFTYEASLHRYALIPNGFRGALGRRVALIRPDPSVADARFLLYLFLSPTWRDTVLARINIGSTVDRIPLVDFPKFPVQLPPLPTQQKIAAILSAYDDLIENNTRRIHILEEMAQVIYREWFVEFRYPGHEDVPLVESELGMMPEGWRVGRLADFLVLQRGFDLPTRQRLVGSVPVVAATGIHGSHSVAAVRGPGVVTGRSGSLGTVLYVSQDFWPLNTTLWVKEFRSATPELAFFTLQHMSLAKFDSGSAVPTLNRNDISSHRVAVPPSQVISAFSDIARHILMLVDTLNHLSSVLRSTRDLLLPRLIYGEIDVDSLDIDTSGFAA